MGEHVKEVIGNATLYLGDCLDILPTLDKVDAVVTDPPYGIERFKKGGLRFDKSGEYKNGIEWDSKPTCFRHIFEVGKHHIIWGANNFTLPQSEYFFVWDKMQTVDNFASAELAYSDIKQPAKVFRYSIHQHNADEKSKGHPTQKPVRLMEWCITFLPPEAVVVADPYMGSGTTGVACMNLGRRFIGIEKEPKYFEIACERIKMAQAQGRLFE
jgi:site-specific DNA-methyltransferase (adenine-specific)